MPNMISLRTFRLETTKGHIIQFEARKPKFVPDVIVGEAMAAGCVPEEASDQPFYDDLTRAKVEFQGDVRKSMLYLAVKAVAEENDPKKFDGGGYPKTPVVAGKLGFEVSRNELVDVYQQYLSAKQSGAEFVLHPAASNIQRVLDAEDIGELRELAAEFGVDKKKADGLASRDLRKLLLVKFTGVAAD